MAISAEAWYGVSLPKEARAVRKTLEDFYYGNLTPGEQETVPNSELRRAVVKVTQREQQLTEQLNEAEQIILNELVSVQHIVDSITAEENFILGFRLGIRMMCTGP